MDQIIEWEYATVCHLNWQKLEGRVATDEDLKLSDTLRYYMKDSSAAKDLLYRRARALADYENANKALEKARLKNKEVAQVKDYFLNVTKSKRKLKSKLRSKNWGYKQLNDFITCIVPEYQGIYLAIPDIQEYCQSIWHVSW